LDREYYGYGLLRASCAKPIEILPPLAFSVVAETAAQAGTTSFGRA
jgi:hypothetical protein